MMEIDRKDMKAQARAAMQHTSPRFWVVTLVYLLMTTGVSLLLSLIPVPVDQAGGLGSASIFLSILLSLYTAVVGFGYTLWSLWTIRQLNPDLSSLIQGFSVSGRVILLEVFLYVRIFCWFFLLSFLVSTVYLMVAPLLFRNALLSIAVMYAVLYGAVWVIALRYSMSHFLLADYPNDGPALAIKRSVGLMQGWKTSLLKLELSFLGWYLPILLLELLVQVGALWYFGFFQLTIPPTLEGLMLALTCYTSVASHPLTILAGMLVTLPLVLWFTPYRSVTLACFYCTRLHLPYPSNQESPMPPV